MDGRSDPSDAAKLVVLWWALLAFIGSGFEHSIANVTTFTLAALDGTIGWGALGRNLLWTIPGNIVGGGLVVGLGYAWMDGARSRARRPVGVECRPPSRWTEPPGAARTRCGRRSAPVATRSSVAPRALVADAHPSVGGRPSVGRPGARLSTLGRRPTLGWVR